MATIKINGRPVIHVDADSGEIIARTDHCIEIKDGLLTEKEKQKQEYLKTHDTKFNRNAGFVKMYVDAIYVMSKKLSPKEFTVALALSKFVDYETCVLKFGTGKNKHDMTVKEIAAEMNMDYTRASRIINSLISNGVIGEFKTGVAGQKGKRIKKLIVNPYIYLNGKNPELYVIYHFFANTGWKEFIESTENVVEILDTGDRKIG